MSTSAPAEADSSSLESIVPPPPSAEATHAPGPLPSPPLSLLHPQKDVKVASTSHKALARPLNSILFFDPTSEQAAKLSADLLALFPSEPSFVTTTLEEATHVLLAHPSSTFADDLCQKRARSPPPSPSSSSSFSRPQQLLTLEWVEDSIRSNEWQPEEDYVYEVVLGKEGKGKEREISTASTSIVDSAAPGPGLPAKRVSKVVQKTETAKPKTKKKSIATAYTVQETNDLRRFLRESQTISDACEKMVQAHPRRTAGTVRTYYSRNKDEFEDELGTDVTQQPSWIWTTEEHDLLVKVLAGPVGSLNRGFKAFSAVHPKRSVIAAAKHYQSNRIRLEREIEAYQNDPSSSKLSRKRSPSSSSSSSEMEWGAQEDEEGEEELVQNLPKKRKKPAPSIPYTEEETKDLQKILRESETLKEAAEKMEKLHPRRTAVSIGMYTYRHPETFVHDFKARPPSISWTKLEQDDLVRTFATSTETLLMQCQAVSNMHPHRTPLAISAYYFKHRDRLTPLIDAIKATLPPPPPPPPQPSTTPNPTQHNFASVLGAIDSLLLQNNPQADQPAAPKRESPTTPPSPKRGRLDASPPPESILLPSAASLGLALALPRLEAPKPNVVKPEPTLKLKKEPKPKKEKKVKQKKSVKVEEEQEEIALPVVVPASKPAPGRIILRLPSSSSNSNLSNSTSSTSTSTSTSTSSSATSRTSPRKVSPAKTRKTTNEVVEVPSAPPASEDPPAAPVAMFSLPRLGLPSLAKATK